ncbi:MAG TPA: hypothetical protein V6D47_04310 [Oscillatoriaceae cyanobacterium]
MLMLVFVFVFVFVMVMLAGLVVLAMRLIVRRVFSFEVRLTMGMMVALLALWLAHARFLLDLVPIRP